MNALFPLYGLAYAQFAAELVLAIAAVDCPGAAVPQAGAPLPAQGVTHLAFCPIFWYDRGWKERGQFYGKQGFTSANSIAKAGRHRPAFFDLSL